MPRRSTLGGLLAATLLALSGCAPGTAAELPPGVGASVQQSRADLGIRRLQVAVHNGSSAELRVTGLSLESTQFAEAAVWAKDSTTVAAGRTVNLPVQLPEPRCGDDPSAPVAVLAFELPDGSAGSARLIADDPGGRMPRLAAEDCLAREVAGHAAITAGTLPRVEQVGAMTVARLDLAIDPTGAPGELLIEEVRGTVLLSLADPADGARVTTRGLGLRVDEASGASAVTLTLVPARCDPHAIAEDKRGTVFALEVRVDGASGSVDVAAAPEVKAALFDFVQAACAR
jgi:hypothetical protein